MYVKSMNKGTVAGRFYLGKVIGVFWKSGAIHGTHNRTEWLDTTKELSGLDLEVYENVSHSIRPRSEPNVYLMSA
jgi:hypothetical protein